MADFEQGLSFPLAEAGTERTDHDHPGEVGGTVPRGAPPSRIPRRTLLKGAAGAAAGTIVYAAGAEFASADTATRLEAYADRTSVFTGGRIRFFVHNGLSGGRTSNATMSIVRVDHPDDVTVAQRTITVRAQTTPQQAWAVGCGWTETAAWDVPADAPSGLYRAVFIAGSLRTVAWFVVRPRQPTPGTTILCQVPFTTLQAYNEWGGKCLYEFRSTNRVRSHRVSFDRPHANPEYGDLWQWVRPFVKWARSRGIAIDYASSIDLHTEANLLDPYQMFVTVGHDEYWSREMRDHLDRFVAEGGNAAILSGNTMYWQVRFEPNAAGEPNRVMVCYKDWNADPISDPNLKTVEWEEFGPRWKHALGADSQHRSIGLGFERGGVWSGSASRPDTPFVVHRPDHWVFAGTGLAKGSRFGGRFVGYETDSLIWTMRDGVPVPTGEDGAPSNLIILATADLSRWAAAGERAGEAAIGIFRNNGTVVNVGTIDWAKGLEAGDPTIERITRNVFEQLAAPKDARHSALVQLQQYHAVNSDGGWRFVFSASPFLTQPRTGWTWDHPVFWVFTGPVPGEDLVPVRQYHAVNLDGGWNILYRLDGDDPTPGWVYDGVGFWAHGEAGPGRVAIHEHSAPTAGGVPRVVYTELAELGLGWTHERVAFWAPSPPPTLNEL